MKKKKAIKIVVAVFLFIGGKTTVDGVDFSESSGWYMATALTWATMFILPAMIALLGSYMICREEQDDTMKQLRLIPINETKLTVAKMIVTFALSVLIYLLLFIITFIIEAALHFSELSMREVLMSLKMYLIQGVGVFFAVSPIIAIVPYMKKSYWLALLLAEIYSFSALFMSMSRTFEKKEIKYAPPVRSEKKIGNTTFIVNSFFPEQAKDGVVSKIERLIKDEVRKKAITT